MFDDEYEYIIIYITKYSNSDRVHELNYLTSKHKDVVIASDISLKNRRLKEKQDEEDLTPLWLVIENTGRGIFLASKIYRKFKPWVSIMLGKIVYFHEFPYQFQEMEKWTKTAEKTLGNMKLSK